VVAEALVNGVPAGERSRRPGELQWRWIRPAAAGGFDRALADSVGRSGRAVDGGDRRLAFDQRSILSAVARTREAARMYSREALKPLRISSSHWRRGREPPSGTVHPLGWRPS
jgi:hypothetical protein